MGVRMASQVNASRMIANPLMRTRPRAARAGNELAWPAALWLNPPMRAAYRLSSARPMTCVHCGSLYSMPPAPIKLQTISEESSMPRRHAGSQSNVPLERGNEVPDLRCLREQVVDTLL